MSGISPTAHDFIEATKHVEDGPLGLDHMPAFRGAESGGPGLEFSFEYLGVLFAVRAEASEQKTRMSYRANLGAMPYTAEDPAARQGATQILYAATQALGGRVGVTSRQRVILADDLVLDEPLTPTVLLARTVRLVLQAKPYLELLSLYVKPVTAPAAAPGQPG